ncbi:MAG: glycosyl transferase family 1 [Pseudomonadota bacterium]
MAKPTRRIAFFGHDIHDAAVRRRALAFLADGLDVTGFMMRRGQSAETEWPTIDLGETRDGAFANRIRQIFAGAHKVAASGCLQKADLIYARNLDMLACAFEAKRLLKLDTEVVYECLDVHRSLVGHGLLGATMRQLEGRLLRRCKALVVSSPAFVREHFKPRYGLDIPVYLVENRMVDGMDYGARPLSFVQPSSAGPLRLGWFGILRCARSLDLLTSLAGALGDRIHINLRGRVSIKELPDFNSKISDFPNISFDGAFKAPEDLAEIYGSVDLVWAGDFMEAGFNSVWLLPNRLYEGGYFAVPPIAPSGTQTARWIKAKACGYEVAEPLHETLIELIGNLLEHREDVEEQSQALLALPDEVFVQPRGAMRDLLNEILGE